MTRQSRTPIHEDFASSGALSALRRQERWVHRQFPGLLQSANLGADLVDINVTVPADPHSALQTIRTLRRARVVLDSVLNGEALPPLPGDPEVDLCEMDQAMLMNMTRLSYGDMLESATRLRASRHCTADEMPVMASSRCVVARLMVDSYFISCWTSAHAEWIETRSSTRQLERDLNMFASGLENARADINLVVYAVTTLPDLGGLIERRCPCSVASKSSVTMTSLLHRCTNAGSRGWDAALKEATLDSNGCARVVFRALAAVCTGMHSFIHPLNRPSWEERMRIYRCLCTLDTKALIQGSGVAAKETLRMYVAVILGNMPATRHAMLAAGQPAGRLVASPFELPAVSLVAAMTQMLREAKWQWISHPVPPTVQSFTTALIASLTYRAKKRKSCVKSSPSPVAVVYTSSWLGRSHPLCSKGKTLVHASTEVFFKAFKSHFVPMWHYHWAQGHRVSRLEMSHHHELHTKNPAAVLCTALPDADSLYVQRLVLEDQRLGILTLREAQSLLGIQRSSNSEEGVSTIRHMCAEDAAKLLTMARTAAAAEKLVAYNLGDTTRRLHVDAVCRRLLQPRLSEETDAQAVARLPKTSTHLMLCVACRRVANACQDGSGTNCPFNEIGISSSMLRVDGDLADGHMRCAKRTSAALRTAMQMEENSLRTPQQQSTAVVKYNASSAIEKLRRDSKSVYDQAGAAVSCGAQPLVSVPLVGRVVNVFGTVYSLCSYCGCICTVEPHNRYGSEICCTRCDFNMLYRDRKHPDTDAPQDALLKCRYCGREDAHKSVGGRFKVVKASNDTVGHNASLPPPLRWVAFCPAHWKPWMQSAVDVMDMCEVFSHISSRCRPIFAAACSRKQIEYTGVSQNNTAIVVSNTTKRKGPPRSVARMLKRGGRVSKGVSKRRVYT